MDDCMADDGTLYVASDDTNGFGHECSSNLALNRLEGIPPDVSGVTINTIEANRHASELGPDRAHWKASGLTSVDGILYLSVSRMFYPEAMMARGCGCSPATIAAQRPIIASISCHWI